MKSAAGILLFFIAYTLFSNINAQNVYLSPVLSNAINENNETYSVLIVLNEQLDFELLKADFNRNKISIDKRAKTVIKLLHEQKNRSQKSIIEFIDEYNSTKSVKIEIQKQYWISNLILVETNKMGIEYLLNNNDINYLELASQGIELVEPIETPESSTLKDLTAPEPGLIAINAPAMWALGYTGRGTVIYGYDTGVWPNHPAFSNRYMGLFYPPGQCWYGFWNAAPTGVLNNHGTHTLGTAIGLDKSINDTIGVAFEAYWIATDIIKGTINEIPPVSDLVEAFEWALNPDGDTSTVYDIPDVINNSWRWRDQIDTVECQGFVVNLLNAIEAVGIANVFSGGNTGPSNTGLNSPQRVKTNVVNSFCVGAIDGNVVTYPIASFSTRGPSQCPVSDSSLSIHPEIVAPGYNVRSAWNTDEYHTISGTSMSCPHVSGAILLLKEAYPFLPGEELMKALYYTATDLGVIGEDNVYGMGLIDVYAAYEYLALTYTPVSPNYPYDVAISQVLGPNGEVYCDSIISPEVFVANLGDSTITEFTLYYTLNNNAEQNVVWTGTLPANNDVSVILPSISLPQTGDFEFNFRVEIADTLADVDCHNNRRYYKSKYVSTYYAPFAEDFESGIDPNKWIITNFDDAETWDTVTTIPYTTGMYSLYIPFNSNIEAGETDELLSLLINLSSLGTFDTLTLSFDVAYQRRISVYNDSLKVYMSDDCSQSFSYLLYESGGLELSTYNTPTYNFFPASSAQWKREFVHITCLNPSDEILLKFIGINEKGNNLFIDNIMLEAGAIYFNKRNVVNTKIDIYPNPAKDILYLKTENKVEIEISSIDGKKIQKETYNGNSTINIKSLSKGLYFVTIKDKNGILLLTKKIIKN